MTKKRVRSVPIYVWVRPDELEVIRERMAEAGIRNMSAYIRKMALGGDVLHVDLDPVKELVSLCKQSQSGGHPRQQLRRLVPGRAEASAKGLRRPVGAVV